MNIETVTSAELLAVPLHEPERVFSAAIDASMREFRKLRMRFHPDRQGGDASVFNHITALYDSCEEKLKAGTWSIPGFLQLTTLNNRKFEFKYLTRRSFELGEEYIGHTAVLYALRDEYDDLFKNAQRSLTNAVNSKTSDDLKRLLPELNTTFSTSTHRVLVFNKRQYQLSLREVVKYTGGKLDSKHAAWVCSRLHHIAVHLTRVGVVHGDVSLDSVFIDPQTHSAALLGGWWYTAPLGRSLRGSALPARTMALGVVASHRPVAEARITGECIRATVREALGEAIPSKLAQDKSIPKPMRQWLQEVASDDTLADYGQWYDKILPAAFGARKFHVLDVTPEQLYPKDKP